MNNLNKNRNKEVILQQAKKMKNFLEKDFSFDIIYENCEKKKNTTSIVDFTNTAYSAGKKYFFPFGPQEALLVFQACLKSNTLDQLIINTFSENSLKRYNFEIENIEEKSRELAKWDYSDIVISAIYFYLSFLHQQYLKRKSFSKTKSFYELKKLIPDLGILFLNKSYGKSLFNVIENTKLFKMYTSEFLSGFNWLFRSQNKSQTFADRHSVNREWFFTNINEYFEINFKNISLYLQAFQDFIPLPLINYANNFCCETQTVYILHYIVKMYQSFFDTTKTKEQKENDYYTFISHIELELEGVFPKNSFLNIFNPFFSKDSLGLVFFIITMNYLSDQTLILGLFSGSNRPIDPSKIIPHKSPSQPLVGNNLNRLKLQQDRRNLEAEQKRLKENRDYDRYLAQIYKNAGLHFNALLLPKSKSLAFADPLQNYISQLGRSDSYKKLLADKKECNEYAKTNYPNFESFPKTVQDHVWNVFYRELIQLPRDRARCINTTNFLNAAREYSKAGQVLDRPIEELKNSHIDDVSHSLLDLSRVGMWDYAFKNCPDDIEFLAQNGYLEILEQAYQDNQLVGVSEMSVFSKKFNLEEVGEAPLITYVVQHAFIRAAGVLKELENESDFDSVGKKVTLQHMIDTAIVKHHSIKNLVDGVMRSLNLPEDHISLTYVNGNIDRIFAELRVQGTSAIFRYQIYMEELDLPRLSKDELQQIRIMLYNGSDIDSVTDENLVLQDLDEFNEAADLKIGEYNNQAGSKSLDKSEYKNQKHLWYQKKDSEILQGFNFEDVLPFRSVSSSTSDDIAASVAISTTNKSTSEQPETQADDAEQNELSSVSTTNKFNTDQPETQSDDAEQDESSQPETQADDVEQDQPSESSTIQEQSDGGVIDELGDTFQEF